MRAIFIDPFYKFIAVGEYIGEFETINGFIGNRYFTTVDLDAKNALYVDDEGLLRPLVYAWTYGPPNGRFNIYAGRGMILGFDIETGETVPATVELQHVIDNVKFLGSRHGML